MTSKFSIDNRELLQRISSGEAVVGIDFGNLIVRELAAFRLAAMDSETVEMPLDYLQGHKDGLEWAARLAEANHPETGDWLYDDPIELAKAIRKGPDMPPAQPAPVVEREPIAWLNDAYLARGVVDGEAGSEDAGPGYIPVYRHAQPAPDREQIRNDHAEWSQSTFGNVGPIGPLKHLSKEALEAAADPSDLSEWADMQFLLWDAQRRAGITDEQITQAMIEKLAVNKQREWPAPKDGEPRLHIKTQPAPVIPDRSIFEKWWESQNGAPLDGWDSLRTTDGYCDDGIDWQFEAWNAAMLAAAPQSPGSEPATVPGKWIPVSERMPEDRKQVILWDAEIGEVTSGHYSHKTQTFYHCGDAIENEITHWMPPPCAPQEVK
ncbi:DUF550 domain-containing protein [Klebsiella pneumoniae]|nr:dATP/dGTP pyrophosphohydrolase domain-containing protein [Klebsiella pneumoniae]MBW5641359.1 DUF550 domain-containing protein [Klebsiella pneumoniae]